MLKDHLLCFFTYFVRASAVVSGCIVALVGVIGVLTILFGNQEETFISKFKPIVQSNHVGSIVSPYGKSPIILEINLVGNIGGSQSNSDAVRAQLTSAFRGKMIDHRKIKAIFLNIRSPGGLSTEGHAIYEIISMWKSNSSVPVYAFVDGLCASAAFNIACCADRILAVEGSIIGSIGSMFMLWNMSGLLNKLGVECKTPYRGKYKTDLMPFSPTGKKEIDRLDKLLDESYEHFIRVVCSRRPIDENMLRNVIGAGIMNSKDALSMGFIDQVCNSRESAIGFILDDIGLDNCSVVEFAASSSIKQVVSEMYSSIQSFGSLFNEVIVS